MIGRVEIDGRSYEIEQIGGHITLRRLDLTGRQSVRADGNRLYNLGTGAWDIAEIGRVVRRIERESLFDLAPQLTCLAEQIASMPPT